MIKAFGIPDPDKMDPRTAATKVPLEFYGRTPRLRFIGIDGTVTAIGPAIYSWSTELEQNSSKY